MSYVGILQAMGLAKESVVGTLVTPPTEFLPMIAPDSFTESIQLLESKGIRAQPDAVVKVIQGPADLKNGKIKIECEPENCGNQFMAAFGTDTAAESPTSFVISSGVNDKINFKENGGSQLTATIAAATYILGTTSATASTLCKAVKTALEAAAGATLTYTVTYSYSTKKMTITASSTTVQILWLTGTNQATSAWSVLGWTHADTSAALAVTSNGTTATAPFTHTFTRLSSAQLPTYSFWFHKGAKYFQFTGCMQSKLVVDIKAKEMVHLDTDWCALAYDDTGSSQSPTYSALKPFTFNQGVVTIDGSQINDYEDLQFTIDNMVEADHALSNSIYPNKIVSKGMRVTISATLFLEDATQWNKFLAGTSASFNIAMTSGENIPGSSPSVPYKLTIDVPVVNYTAAPLPIENGILKIHFSAVAVFDSNTSKTLSVALRNSVATAY